MGRGEGFTHRVCIGLNPNTWFPNHEHAKCKLVMYKTSHSPVMNMAEEMVEVWKQVSIRNDPSFLAVPFSGSELFGGFIGRGLRERGPRLNSNGLHSKATVDPSHQLTHGKSFPLSAPPTLTRRTGRGPWPRGRRCLRHGQPPRGWRGTGEPRPSPTEVTHTC